MIYKSMLLITLLLLSSIVLSQETVYTSDIAYSHDESGVPLSDIAKQWHLNEKEYIRYTQLIRGPLGRWNANIDPILALGIFSRNEQEKKKYAEMYAENEYALLTKTQEFERAYRSAFIRLFPEAKIISSDRMQSYYDHQEEKNLHPLLSPAHGPFETGDRVLYFAQMNCGTCKRDTAKLQRIIEKYSNIYLDIYILEIANEQEARRWTNENAISIGLIQQSRITINIDDGVFARLNKKSGKDTHFYLNRGDQYFSVNAKDIHSK